VEGLAGLDLELVLLVPPVPTTMLITLNASHRKVEIRQVERRKLKEMGEEKWHSSVHIFLSTVRIRKYIPAFKATTSLQFRNSLLMPSPRW